MPGRAAVAFRWEQQATQAGTGTWSPAAARSDIALKPEEQSTSRRWTADDTLGVGGLGGETKGKDLACRRRFVPA